MATRTEATVEDLYRVPEDGKAELVHGGLVLMAPTGFMPGRASDSITASLREYERRTGSGYAIGDNVGFIVNLPRRRSFSPDAAFFTGKPTGMRFLEDPPIFAAEVRSENDYGQAAEHAMAEKRADYFAAGTLVVWDVDLLASDVVKSYTATDPDKPVLFRRGEMADAELALPGWRMPVDDLFA